MINRFEIRDSKIIKIKVKILKVLIKEPVEEIMFQKVNLSG